MNKNPFKISNLLAFKKIVDEGSLTSAAKRMNCSQGQLSRIVLSMEDQTGTQLFKRDAGGVSLTSSGHLLLSATNNYIAAHDTFMASIARMKEDDANARVIVTAPPGFIHVLANAVMPFIAQKHPNIPMSLSQLRPGDISDYDTALSDTDILLSYVPSKLPSAINRKYSLKMGFYSCKSLAMQSSGLAPKDLINMPCITIENYGTQSNIWCYTDENGIDETLDICGKYQCYDISSAISMAVNNLGVINIPCIIAQPFLEKGKLFQLFLAKGFFKKIFI